MSHYTITLKEGELTRSSVVKDYLTTALDGNFKPRYTQ